MISNDNESTARYKQRSRSIEPLYNDYILNTNNDGIDTETEEGDKRNIVILLSVMHKHSATINILCQAMNKF